MIETFCRKCGKRFRCNGDKICRTSVKHATEGGCFCSEHTYFINSKNKKSLCGFKEPKEKVCFT